MRITPLLQNYYSPRFTSRQDLSESLKERLSQGLSNLVNGESDEFVPMQPTQPIIVREVKIYKNKGKGTGKAEAIASGVGGVGGGIGISKIKGKGSSDNSDRQEEQKVDFDKIADESVQETRASGVDEYSEIADDNDNPDDFDIGADDDMDDYDEE